MIKDLLATLDFDPNGKLFVIVDTPFMQCWEPCIKVFHERKGKKERWPGVFYPAKNYCNEIAIHDLIPDLVHWFDEETISKEIKDAGFKIDKISYINRANIYPERSCLDGRESVVVIATKNL